MSRNPYIYAAIYARQSTRNAKNSIASQISGCEDLAYRNNLMIYKSYSETISATSNNIEERKALTQLLFDAKKNLFKILIVFKRDRLARNFEDFKKLDKIFKRLGIKVIYTHDFNAPDDNSSISGFIENVLMAVSELEPRTTAMRTKEGLVKMREHGQYHSPNCPFGFKKENKLIKNRNCKIYKKVDEEANIIKQLFDYFLKLKDKFSATTFLNTLDKSLVNRLKLTPTKINSFLYHPIYAGLVPNKISYRIQGTSLIDEDTDDIFEISPDLFIDAINVDAIISKDQWFETIKKLSTIKDSNNNFKKSRPVNLLSKKVFCNNCEK